jgi:monofunctional glycosyltransferase
MHANTPTITLTEADCAEIEAFQRRGGRGRGRRRAAAGSTGPALRWLRRIFKWSVFTLLCFIVASVLLVVLFRWVNPPLSAVMMTHWVSAAFESGTKSPYIHHQWVDWELIPPQVALAVIAGEDQRFPEHDGFDVVEMRKAWEKFQDGGRLRGASTISQQTAKNLFLWSGRDYVRKGLEAWFTVLIEALWPKQRIMEVYLNIAQLGPDTYGVGAASWRYLNRPVFALRNEDAALLAAVLPNPNIYRLEDPSARVHRRASWIRRQMQRLGGTDYLHRL